MDLAKLEKALGYAFKDKALLQEALTHRSYLNENKNWPHPHNERLEFLGDAVLELVCTDHLFKNFKLEEGVLTSYRAALVNAQSLAEASTKLSLNSHLLLSKGEAKDSNGKGRQEILGNAFEALVGAIYLDGGYEPARAFVEQLLLPRLEEIIELQLYKDPKSRFQEEAQARAGITPSYKLLKQWGPDHDRRFLVGVYLDEYEVAQGQGSSKQAAEVEAAARALEIKEWNRD